MHGRRQFERIARLRPFRLPGGEAAIREPWRIAVAICQQLDESSRLSGSGRIGASKRIE